MERDKDFLYEGQSERNTRDDVRNLIIKRATLRFDGLATALAANRETNEAFILASMASKPSQAMLDRALAAISPIHQTKLRPIWWTDPDLGTTQVNWNKPIVKADFGPTNTEILRVEPQLISPDFVQLGPVLKVTYPLTVFQWGDRKDQLTGLVTIHTDVRLYYRHDQNPQNDRLAQITSIDQSVIWDDQSQQILDQFRQQVEARSSRAIRRTQKAAQHPLQHFEQPKND